MASPIADVAEVVPSCSASMNEEMDLWMRAAASSSPRSRA